MLNKGKSQIKEYYVHIPFVYVFLVKARTFPNLHGTYILEGPAQVTQVRTEYTSGAYKVLQLEAKLQHPGT